MSIKSDFEHEKYEYLLQVWGGFYNEQNKSKHGLDPGYFWFNTEEDRQEYLDNLKEISKKYNAMYLATRLCEGKYVRYKTVATMTLVYQEKQYQYKYDFGFAYLVDSAIFMWKDGNYSCDCNRSIFLSRQYPGFPELICGNKIEVRDFEVKQERS
jgi:hypothetical protein